VGLPALQGDPHLIEGALLNLVSNAIKYSARGSEVKLRAEVEGDGVVLEVWNPGPRFHRRSYYVSSNRFIGEVNRKKQREDGDLDWPSSNELPNNTEGRPRPGANLGQGHLFVSICQ